MNGTNADVKRHVSCTRQIVSFELQIEFQSQFPFKITQNYGKTCNPYVTRNLSRWRKSMSMTPSLTTCKKNCWNWKKARNERESFSRNFFFSFKKIITPFPRREMNKNDDSWCDKKEKMFKFKKKFWRYNLMRKKIKVFINYLSIKQTDNNHILRILIGQRFVSICNLDSLLSISALELDGGHVLNYEF